VFDVPEISFENILYPPLKHFSVWRDINFCVLNSNQQRRKVRGCRSVELRALCNEVPRTPPGPEGSNGIGITSGAADHPKFLASKAYFDSGFCRVCVFCFFG
jgi:hypothetical protein